MQRDGNRKIGMAWVVLIVAALLEPVWATALKYSEGLTRFVPSAIGLTISVVSVILLTTTLKILPAGTAYAVWVGIGVCGVVIAGIVLFGESASIPRLLCVALILIGVIGLHIVER